MVVGAYGKVMHKQFGAPIRLHTPWKYGFKSIKSIDTITFSDKRPVSFWEELQAKEYGFWANVNPEVAHPRWSQATEKVLGTSDRIPTVLFNGYGDQVAHLYTDIQEGDTNIVFTSKLTKGSHQLSPVFKTADGKEVGAYYLIVTPLK